MDTNMGTLLNLRKFTMFVNVCLTALWEVLQYINIAVSRCKTNDQRLHFVSYRWRSITKQRSKNAWNKFVSQNKSEKPRSHPVCTKCVTWKRLLSSEEMDSDNRQIGFCGFLVKCKVFWCKRKNDYVRKLGVNVSCT